MAMFKNGVGGVLSGMIGPVVMVTGKNGKVYIRRAPKKHKFSEKQKQNWKRFSAVSAFWKKFEGTLIQQIWKVAEEGRRGINLFINANAPAFSPEGELIEPERLHFSAGQLPLPHKLTGGKNSDGKLQVSWETANGNNLTRSEDELMILYYRDDDFNGPHPTGFMRKKGSAVFDLDQDVKGVYLFFRSEKRKLYSQDLFIKIS